VQLIRVSIGALDTEQPDVDVVWELLQRCALELSEAAPRTQAYGEVGQRARARPMLCR